MVLEGGTLGVDVGGSNVKAMVLDPNGAPMNQRVRIETPRPAHPQAILQTIQAIAAQCPSFERVSIGFPGVVVDGVVFTAPNLDGDWAGVPLAAEVEKLLGKPVRAANDADVQGLGVVEGIGVELTLTLGTGMGSALFLDGRLVPNLELGHHPFRKRSTYEDCLGQAALERVGKRRWNARLRKAIATLEAAFNYRVLYIGGGNVRLVKGELPANVRLVDNVAGITGGIKLWQ